MDKGLPKVCVVGLGYIGLPTASLLATKGFDVLGVDVSEYVVKTINAGAIHIEEPELDVLVRSAVQSGRLAAALAPAAADVFILAVPTPFRDGYKPDLDYVEAAARSIASQVKPGDLVILESTSPVGTTERVAEWLRAERPDLVLPRRLAASAAQSEAAEVRVAHCPERVLPGQILRELVENDRIVGGINPASTQAAARFYRRFVSGDVLETDSRTAELAKLSENTFRDVNIAFANELASVCEELDVDAWKLIELANHHPRVNILRPGPGVGGHCIAVDPWFIVDSAPEHTRLIRAAREINNARPGQVVEKVLASVCGLVNPTIACLGLAYKPDIDDLRESPAVEIAETLARQDGFRVLAVEPHISELPARLSERGIELAEMEPAVQAADVVLVLVPHSLFRSLDSERFSSGIVLDVCGLWK